MLCSISVGRLRRAFWVLPIALLGSVSAVIASERWSAEQPAESVAPAPVPVSVFQMPMLSAPGRARFPLRVVPGKRHLVDAAGKPFLLNGGTAWSLVVQVKKKGVERYLDDRRRKGFNAILVNLLEHNFAAAPPLNAYGQAPFTRPGDFSSPNEQYFEHVDAIIEKARARHILVLLVPAYLGFGGGDEGWWTEMKANGPAKLRAFGRFLGTRYRRFDNILWVQGGDFDPPEEDRPLVEAVADGIRSVDTKLHTFHGGRGTSALGYWDPRPEWLRVNAIYTHEHDVLESAHLEYRRSTMPFFLIEAKYENEEFPAAAVRQQAYHTILGGGTGSVMGNSSIWPFKAGWQRALGSTGAASMAQLGGFFRSLPWWKLRPDIRHDLVTEGVDEGSEEAVAARARDGSFAVVYVPTARTLEIDLSRLRGSRVSARWYDPVSGRFRRVAGSPFRTNATRSVATPVENAGGDSDVVLLLRSLR